MCLQRFIERLRAVVPLFAMALAVMQGGCVAENGLMRPSAVATTDAGETGTAAAPPSLEDVPPRALTLYEQAVAVMAAGDALEATLRFEEFVLQYPAYPGAHVNLAILYAQTGDEMRAESAIQAALAVDPMHAPALNQLGMLKRRAGLFQASEAAYLKAITASPEYALAHYNLGVLNELYLRRYDAALQHFEQYQALAGEDKQVARWIADLRRRVAASQRTANVAE